jgi:hypothetical protein
MKLWKRGANKKLRSKAKQILHTQEDWDTLLIPHRDEVDNRWNSPMDGRPYIIWCKPDDRECYRDAMRRPDLYTLNEDGHFDMTGKYRHLCCDCIINKKSWYWKSFRK